VDVVDLKALRDPRVVKLLADQLPDLVTAQLTSEARARYETEWRENGGYINDRTIGERVKVASVEYMPPTGEFTFRPVARAGMLLQEAIDAGQMNEWGEFLTGDQPAEPLPDPVPAQEALPIGDSVDARLARARAQMGIEGDEAPAPGPASKGKAGGHDPTPEQQAIGAAFGTGENLVIEAGAGAGKTSTLKMIAQQAGRKRGLYLAFNRSIVDDAAASGEFPAR